MKQFSLDEYLKNLSRKVVTRCSYSVRILCTDKKASLPIVALVTYKNGEEFVGNYNSFGKYNDGNYACSFDLFFAPEKHEGYACICFNEGEYCLDDIIYSSEKDAKNNAGMYGDFVTAVKIEWEE